MNILEIKILRGPNFWSIKKHKLIQMLLDIEELEHRPTNQIPGFLARLKNLLPSLYDHRCSEGVRGGFFKRVEDGTWMGHVIEHIALEIQSLAGMYSSFGQTRGAGKPGQYHVVFSYAEENAGMYAAKAAVRIAEALIKGEEYGLEKDIEELMRLWNGNKLGPSTQSIVDEALRRNIPVIVSEDYPLIQLGYGAKQKGIQASLATSTSAIAVDIAGNKADTKRVLMEAHAPVPQGIDIRSFEALKDAVEMVGYPLVIKPLDGNQGKGATTNIQNWEDAVKAFEYAKTFSDKVVVETFIHGNDFRVLLVNFKFVAAARRTPAAVTGDGEHTIQELINEVNRDCHRGDGHECVLTTIKVDALTEDILKKKNYTLNTVLPAGEELWLKPTANLSTGGTATDVTDEVHPANICLFERVARIIGLDICGIDVMAHDLTTPIKENGGAIIEVNAAPGLRMHLEPATGKPRNVAKPIIDMLFGESNGRIPIVAVTGTNGKTTTSRLIAHIAQSAGHTTGFTTTDGIYINKELVVTGDCSGPASAQFVLRDKCVDFAVLETARGGILRSGLGFDKCDCAVVTNIAEDHLGLGGIDTIEKLAKVKAVVPESVVKDGYAILNADDDLVYAMREQLDCNIALFSLHAENVRILKHCEAGGIAAYSEDGYIILRKGNHIIPIIEIVNAPITFGGKAEFNIANVLAATLAAYTSNIDAYVISRALKSFVPSAQTTPGRVNIFEHKNFKVLMDYAHNPHGIRALGKFILTMPATQRVGVITGVGDRRDEDIIALGEEAARVFDEIIIRLDDDLRGRTPEQMNNLLGKGVNNIDRSKRIIYISNECEASEYAISHALPDSLVVILVDNVSKVQDHLRNCLKIDQFMPNNLKQAV